MASSPTQRSLKYYRDLGFTCQVVEKWNPFAKIRQDLFGFIDIIAICGGKIAGVQSTSYVNHATRKKKILESEIAPLWLEAGGLIIISSWQKKKNGRYEHREEYIT